jgi:hypothetical protein
MPTRMRRYLEALARAATAGALAVACGTALALSPDAVALRDRHDALRDALASSPFRRPLVVQSTAAADELEGEIYAIIDQPFSTTVRLLKDKTRWCEVVMLHQNVKHCRSDRGDAMAIVVGRKAEDTARQGYKMDFTFDLQSLGPDFVRVQLAAGAGPLGTRNHRVTLQAAPLDAGSSFIHLSYGYSFGGIARMMTQAYMTTAGRDKVGFTVMGKTKDGQPIYINGVRAMVERNAMRYFLAIEAYFNALSAPPAQQQERRLNDWFALTEQHPRQLHELERDEYLAIKRRELAIQ